MILTPDKHGYYLAGNFKTYRKFYAVLEDISSHCGVKWVFNDTAFQSHNWKTEPKESLSELYKKRAEEIRECYDYVVVFYSGGSDSHHILNVFVDNNIHVDEVASGCSVKGDSGPYGYYGYYSEEVFKVAIPYLDSIREKIPHTHRRVIDQTDMILNWFKSPDFVMDHSNSLTPNCVTRSQFREHVPDYKKLINSGKKVGFVWGIDKPQIHYDKKTDSYYTTFDDILDYNVSPYSQLRFNQGWFDEYFFYSPDAVHLLAKQCHTIVNGLRSDSIPARFFTLNKTKYGFSPTRKQYLTAGGVNHLLYSSWQEGTFSNGKNPSLIYGARDGWFFKNCQTSDAYANWKKGIDYIDSTYRTRNWLNTDNIFDNVKGVLSNRYYIE